MRRIEAAAPARLIHSAEAVIEGVTGLAHSADRVSHLAAVDRLAQPADMHIDGTFVDVDVRTPDPVEQLLAGKYAARTLHQKFQQAVFGRPQIDSTAAARHSFFLAVQFDVANAEHSRNPIRISAAQQRPHACQQFRHREWLDDVIVGAGGEPPHLFTFLAPRSQHDDRQLARLGARTQAAAQFDARQSRQHPVEHYEIGRALLQTRVRFIPAGGSLDLVAFRLEVVTEQHGERLLVLYDQYARVHAKTFYLSPVRSAAIVVVSPFGRWS